MRRYETLLWIVVIPLALGFLVRCASIPELQVLYKMPQSTFRLKGKEVRLEIYDSRPSKKLFTPAASREFGVFTGNLSYSFARYNEKGFKIGVFSLQEVLEKSFIKRLEADGLKVVSDKDSGLPKLVVVIEKLHLDYASRRWIAEMAYEVKITKGGRVLASQHLSGKVERTKLLGRKGADAVISELLTEMVNRLDVAKLLAQAHLLP